MLRPLILLLASALLLAPGPAWALDPAYAITQYGHRAWRVGEAGLDSSPSAIAQTTDGQIWVGTTDGLYRFDGKRFSIWQRTNGPPISFGLVENLFSSRSGDLYIASRTGLSRISHGVYYRYPEFSNLPGPIMEDAAGGVWVASRAETDHAEICSVGQKSLKCFGPRAGFPCPGVAGVFDGKKEEFWIGGRAGICRWSPGHPAKTYTLGGARTPIGDLTIDRSRTLWTSVVSGGANSGLWWFKSGSWNAYKLPGIDKARWQIQTLFSDQEGSTWIGPLDRGLYRAQENHIEHYDHGDGLSGDTVYYLTQDHEGSIWVATTRGIDQFFSIPIVPFTAREGLSGDEVTWVTPAPDGSILTGQLTSVDRISESGDVSLVAKFSGNDNAGQVFADSKGRVWYSTATRLLLFEQGRVRQIKLGAKGAPAQVYSFAEDAHHSLWLGGRDLGSPAHGWLWRIDENLRVHRLPSPAETGQGIVFRVASDFKDGLWVVIRRRAVYHFQGGRFSRVASLDALAGKQIVDILPVAPGEAWFATEEGAAWLQNGRIRLLNTASGLPCDKLYGLAFDDPGNLWLTSTCGLLGVPKDDLSRWRQSSNYRVHVKVLGPDSGYSADETSHLVKSGSGKLWYAANSEAHEFDPAHVAINRLAPPVQLQGLQADQRSFAVAARVILPRLTHNLEIDYAALSYLQPDLLKFRYRLFGHDREWNDAGNRRGAFYNDLPPGAYRFQVTACNKDGVCNRQGASTTIVIPAAWWQTWWFKALCVLAALTAAALLIRWRLDAYAQQARLRFDAQLQERTRVARDLHDTLMQTVLASKMLAEGASRPDSNAETMLSALARLSTWLGRAAEEGRATVNSLRVTADVSRDLAEAFEAAATEGCPESETEIIVTVTGAPRELHPIVRGEVEHIGVEAIRNACAHAEASHILVALEYAQSLTLRVSDDGVGIDQAVLTKGKAGHFGLLGMRERAERIGARLSVFNTSLGAEVALVVPGRVAFSRTSWPRAALQRLWPWSQARQGRRQAAAGPKMRLHDAESPVSRADARAWRGEDIGPRKEACSDLRSRLWGAQLYIVRMQSPA